MAFRLPVGAFPSREDDGDPFARSRGAGRGQQRGQARRSGGADGDPRGPAELVGLDDGRLRRDDDLPAGAPRRRRARRASRRPRRRGCRPLPSAGQATASSARSNGAATSAGSSPPPAPTPPPSARTPRSARRRDGLPGPGPTQCTRRAPRLRPARRCGRRRRHRRSPSRSCARRRDTVRCRALARRRGRRRRRPPRGTAAPPGRQAGHRRDRVHRVIDASSTSNSPSTAAPAHSGTNTSIGHSDRAGERRRGDRRVAARGDGQRAPCPVDEAQRLRRTQVEHDRDEVPALVAATHVAGLVLHPRHRGRRCGVARTVSRRTRRRHRG